MCEEAWEDGRVGILWSFWGAFSEKHVFWIRNWNTETMEEGGFELFLGSGISSHPQKTRGRRIWVLEGWAPGSGGSAQVSEGAGICVLQGNNYSPVPDSLFIIVWLLESHFISLNFNNRQSNIWITASTLSSFPPQECWVSEEVIIDTLHVKPCF